jgi:hypothetical protein
MDPTLESRSEPLTQAERIIAKFGGPATLAKLIGRNPASVYRWTYSRAIGGTDGLIPSSALRLVLDAARKEGIFITSDDLYPGRG